MRFGFTNNSAFHLLPAFGTGFGAEGGKQFHFGSPTPVPAAEQRFPLPLTAIGQPAQARMATEVSNRHPAGRLSFPRSAGLHHQPNRFQPHVLHLFTGLFEHSQGLASVTVALTAGSREVSVRTVWLATVYRRFPIQGTFIISCLTEREKRGILCKRLTYESVPPVRHGPGHSVR
jgi:hypothetical protein